MTDVVMDTVVVANAADVGELDGDVSAVDGAAITRLLKMRPGKVIAVHLNYPSRAAQRGRTPQHPSYFFKPASSLAVGGGAVQRPANTELLAFEGEVALVIGRDVRRVDPEEGWAAVASVTAANDMGVYDLRAADRGSNLRSKGGDGFTPLGPALLPAADLDPAGLRVRTWLDGELVQDDTTADLLFPFGQLVADLSEMLTLQAGDIILTGTPAGASVAVPGQVVEVEVDAPDQPGSPTTGRLVTRVVEGPGVGGHGAPPAADDAQRAEAWGSAAAAGLTQTAGATEEPFVLTTARRAAIGSVAVATLSAQLRSRGFDDVSVDGVRPTRPGHRLLGVARTLRYVPFRKDLFASHGGGYNAQKRAIDSLGPGEVLVMEARGETATGTLGDILALRAAVLGAAGVVTDGGVRDVAAVSEIDLPVYHGGAHPAVLGRRHVPWDVDVTIACGGATVQPGDVVVGDDDGVLVIPPHLVDEVVAAATEQERVETFIAERVADGEAVDGLYPLGPAWRERYQAWCAQRSTTTDQTDPTERRR